MISEEESLNLLKEIAYHPEITSSDITQKFNLTDSQVDYRINKINKFLIKNGYKRIVKTKRKKIIVDKEVRAFISKNTRKTASKKTLYSENDRILIIIYLLVSSNDDLSLYHFMDALQVSINTVLRDLKKVRLLISSYRLVLFYSRKTGYTIQGDEWDIRNLLSGVIIHLYDSFGEDILQKFGEIKKENVDLCKEKLIELEKKLSVNYTDRVLNTSVYMILLVERRIIRGFIVKRNFEIAYNDLSDTREYKEIKSLFTQSFLNGIPEKEKLYITLYLLTLNIIKLNSIMPINLAGLEQAIKNFILCFEKLSAVELINKENLEKKLLIHLKPAYYRIKYGLNLSQMENLPREKKIEDIIVIVREAISYLEDFIGAAFPQQEIFLLSVFISGYLPYPNIHLKKVDDHKLRAIVICSRGIIFSSIIKNYLLNIYPDFQSLESMSIENFKINEEKIDADIVFSTEFVNTAKHLVVIDKFDEFEKEKIINEIYKSRFESDFLHENIFLNNIIKKIKNYTYLSDEKSIRLKNDIKELMIHPIKNNFKLNINNTLNSNLSDFLSPEFIQISEKYQNWSVSIETASQPLLRVNMISPQYIENMKKELKEIKPYLILGKEFLIPHLSPDKGVKKEGMSLLKLEKGITFKKNRMFFLVVVAPSKETKNVIHAMSQLLKIANNPHAMNELKASENPNQIYEAIKQYQ